MGALGDCIKKMQESNEDLEGKIKYYSFHNENGDVRYPVAGSGPSSGDSCFLPVITIAILILLIILVIIVMLVPDFGRRGCDNFSDGVGSSKMAARGYYQGDFKSYNEDADNCGC